MRTTEERIEQMHNRAKELQRRSKRRVTGFGSLTAVCMFILTEVLLHAGGLTPISGSDEMTGSSLLGNSAGGYVLAAIIAFFIGVVITALVFRYRRK